MSYAVIKWHLWHACKDFSIFPNQSMLTPCKVNFMLRKWRIEIIWLFQSVQFSSVTQSYPTLWSHELQHRSPPKPMSIVLVMASNHLTLCSPLLLPSIFPSIRVFSNESALRIRWPKYWSFSFNISPSNEHPGLISFRMDWLHFLAVQGLSRVFSNTTVQKQQFFSAQLSSQSNSHIHTWPLGKP